jgi:hypothetical protein
MTNSFDKQVKFSDLVRAYSIRFETLLNEIGQTLSLRRTKEGGILGSPFETKFGRKMEQRRPDETDRFVAKGR